MLPVKEEITGWRDEDLSKRHRRWGWDCPVVDIDFLMVEYNLGKPVALVEYKKYTAAKPNLNHPTYKALCELANADNLPFFIAFYWPGIWAFKITPVNDTAKRYYDTSAIYTEKQYVESLYLLRSRIINSMILDGLNDSLPLVTENITT